jgi:hypothetical protein
VGATGAGLEIGSKLANSRRQFFHGFAILAARSFYLGSYPAGHRMDECGGTGKIRA